MYLTFDKLETVEDYERSFKAATRTIKRIEDKNALEEWYDECFHLDNDRDLDDWNGSKVHFIELIFVEKPGQTDKYLRGIQKTRRPWDSDNTTLMEYKK